MAQPTDQAPKMPEPELKFSPEKLGEYTILKDIAEGTFGKVKSASILTYCSRIFLSSLHSGGSYDNWASSRDEVHIEGGDTTREDKDTSPPRI
jgi:hypothetical protein